MQKYKCPECGKGEMLPEIVPVYQTKLGGIPVEVKNAELARCTNCGKTNITAGEIKRWECLQREQLQKAGSIPTPREVKALRERLGLSNIKLAALLGVTRQAVYGWESDEIGPMSLGPAALMLKLLEAERRGRVSGVYALLRELAKVRGVAESDLPPSSRTARSTRLKRRLPGKRPVFLIETAAYKR